MTVAIYSLHPDGTKQRIGTFTVPGHPNCRKIALAWWKRHPYAVGPYLIVPRSRVMGRWADDIGGAVPMDPREAEEDARG